MKLLKALDAGFTAFCNELWLPTFGFHLFDDPGDALEEDPTDAKLCVCGHRGDDHKRVAGLIDPCTKCECTDCLWPEFADDVPVELAASLGAPGDKSPEEVLSPEVASSGHPTELTFPARDARWGELLKRDPDLYFTIARAKSELLDVVFHLRLLVGGSHRRRKDLDERISAAADEINGAIAALM